jgi:GGDEF domain-containing protein
MKSVPVDLRLSVMGLVASSVVAIGAISALSPPASAGLFALLAGVVVLATLRGGRVLGLLTAVAGTLAFGFAHFATELQLLDPQTSLADPSRVLANPLLQRVEVWSPAVVGMVLLFALVGVAELVSRNVADLAEVAARQQTLIALLAKEDPETGLYSREHALQVADQELARSRRFKRKLALALVGVDPPPPEAVDEGERGRLMAELAAITLDGLRHLDVVGRFDSWEILMVLPETAIDGARVVIGRITTHSAQRLSRAVRVTVMVFPDDGSTIEQLLAELQSALAVCRSAGLTMGDSGLLLGAVGPGGE